MPFGRSYNKMTPKIIFVLLLILLGSASAIDLNVIIFLGE